MMKVVWIVLQIFIGYNLLLPLLLFIIWLLFCRKKSAAVNSGNNFDYAIIVTAYEQTHTLPAVINSILKLNYQHFLVYIVADKCDVTNLKFDDERVIVLRPETTLASNTRSHFYAISRFKRKHDILTIIDSDNLVEPEYLNALNVYFNKGYKAVQGVRKAKNLNTTYACLDAARDIYYHFYDGQVLYEVGSSATLAGSGMAFTVDLYNECLGSLDITGAGFDKVLQFEIVKRGYRIAFTEAAVVYDEKTSHSDQLVKQRARWINTWFRYFHYGFSLLGKGLFKLNVNQFIFGFILLRPPLFIFLILSFLFMVADIFIMPLAAIIWALAFVAFILGFAIALAFGNADKKIYASLINIPKFMFYQVVSLVLSRNANKRSVATTHYHAVDIDAVASNQNNQQHED